MNKTEKVQSKTARQVCDIENFEIFAIFAWPLLSAHCALWNPLISWTHFNDVHKFRGQALNSTNFVDTLWIPLISRTRLEFHLFRGHAALLTVQEMSTFFVESKNVFQEQEQEQQQQRILRLRQRSLAVKK